MEKKNIVSERLELLYEQWLDMEQE